MSSTTSDPNPVELEWLERKLPIYSQAAVRLEAVRVTVASLVEVSSAWQSDNSSFYVADADPNGNYWAAMGKKSSQHQDILANLEAGVGRLRDRAEAVVTELAGRLGRERPTSTAATDSDAYRSTSDEIARLSNVDLLVFLEQHFLRLQEQYEVAIADTRRINDLLTAAVERYGTTSKELLHSSS